MYIIHYISVIISNFGALVIGSNHTWVSELLFSSSVLKNTNWVGAEKRRFLTLSPLPALNYFYMNIFIYKILLYSANRTQLCII